MRVLLALLAVASALKLARDEPAHEASMDEERAAVLSGEGYDASPASLLGFEELDADEDAEDIVGNMKMSEQEAKQLVQTDNEIVDGTLVLAELDEIETGHQGSAAGLLFLSMMKKNIKAEVVARRAENLRWMKVVTQFAKTFASQRQEVDSSAAALNKVYLQFIEAQYQATRTTTLLNKARKKAQKAATLYGKQMRVLSADISKGLRTMTVLYNAMVDPAKGMCKASKPKLTAPPKAATVAGLLQEQSNASMTMGLMDCPHNRRHLSSAPALIQALEGMSYRQRMRTASHIANKLNIPLSDLLKNMQAEDDQEEQEVWAEHVETESELNEMYESAEHDAEDDETEAVETANVEEFADDTPSDAGFGPMMLAQNAELRLSIGEKPDGSVSFVQLGADPAPSPDPRYAECGKPNCDALVPICNEIMGNLIKTHRYLTQKRIMLRNAYNAAKRKSDRRISDLKAAKKKKDDHLAATDVNKGKMEKLVKSNKKTLATTVETHQEDTRKHVKIATQIGRNICALVMFRNAACDKLKIEKPRDCVMTKWQPTKDKNDTGCTAQCGGGVQTYTRRVLLTNSKDGVPCPIITSKTVPCNTQVCPINCMLGRWSGWAECQTSGNKGAIGRQKRTRKMIRQNNKEGAKCKPKMEQQDCFLATDAALKCTGQAGEMKGKTENAVTTRWIPAKNGKQGLIRSFEAATEGGSCTKPTHISKREWRFKITLNCAIRLGRSCRPLKPKEKMSPENFFASKQFFGSSPATSAKAIKWVEPVTTEGDWAKKPGTPEEMWKGAKGSDRMWIGCRKNAAFITSFRFPEKGSNFTDLEVGCSRPNDIKKINDASCKQIPTMEGPFDTFFKDKLGARCPKEHYLVSVSTKALTDKGNRHFWSALDTIECCKRKWKA
jgi:hypothetical protein